MQPAADGDAVRLVDDALGMQAVQVLEHGAAHQLGVERRHAVDAMRAEEGEMPHAKIATAMLVDQRERRELIVGRALLADEFEMAPIDRVDDLHMPRQQPLEERHRPGFQRLGKQRVVGVGECADGDVPGLVPFKSAHVDQHAHQLGDGDRGMRVVQLDRGLVGERADVPVDVEMPPTRSCSEAETKKYSWRTRSS